MKANYSEPYFLYRHICEVEREWDGKTRIKESMCRRVVQLISEECPLVPDIVLGTERKYINKYVSVFHMIGLIKIFKMETC